MAWYSTGSITATNNSGAITGVGTLFMANVRVGDGITIAGSTSIHEVVNVTSDTQLTVSPVYAGTTGSGKSFGVVPVQGYTKDLANQAKSLLLTYSSLASSPSITALAAVNGIADRLPYFTAASTMALANFTPFARALLDDVDGNTMRDTLGVGINQTVKVGALLVNGGTVVELGRYLDLHYDTSATDYHARISMEAPTFLTLDAPSIGLRSWGAAGSSVGISNAASDSQYLFRDGRIDCVNYANSVWKNHQYMGLAYYWKNTAGTDMMSLNSGGRLDVSSSIVSTAGNIHASAGHIYSLQWFVSSYTGGKICMSTGNGVTFHWNGGFYYNIDGNGWVLINASPSDKSVKNVEGSSTAEEAGEIIDKLADKVTKFSFKQNAPLKLPEGSRHGFIAQEVNEIIPTLFQETGAPGGNEDSTLLTYNDDAPYQLISLLVKTVSELRERVANLEQRLA